MLLSLSTVLVLTLPAVAPTVPPCGVFGQFEREIGDLDRPTAVAIAEDGRIAVLERDAGRVRILSSDGAERLRIDRARGSETLPWTVAIGAHEPPPSAVAFAADGRLALVSTDRIAVFDSAGSLWRSMSGVGLRDPVGATWRQDELWVTDRGGGEVVVYGSDLAELRRIGGGVSGELRRPSGIVAAPDGSVFVSDEDLHAILRYDATGARMLRFGERGAFPGLFNVPSGLAINGDCLYVADQLNHRIAIHTFDGAFVGQWGMHAVVPREGEGKIHYPTSIAIAPDGGSAIVAEPMERRLQRFVLSDPSVAPQPMPSREGVQSHFGGAVASDGDLLILEEPESSSVFVFDLRPSTPIRIATFGGQGTGTTKFGRVSAVAVDAQSQRVIVADTGNRRLSMFALARDRAAALKLDAFMPRLVRSWDMVTWSAKARAAGGMDGSGLPLEITGIVEVGDLWWAIDSVDGLLVTMDRTLAPQRAVATGLRGAMGLAVIGDPATPKFVTTLPERGDVVLLATDGQVLARSSQLDGQTFMRPNGVASIAVDGAADRIAVTDAGADRVVILDATLAPVDSVGQRGISDGEFWMPHGVARLDPEFGDASRVGPKFVVVDRGNHRAQLIRNDGSWLMTFGLGRAYTRPRQRGAS